MNPTMSTLFLLLLAFTSSKLPSATAEFVVDIYGNPIRNGGAYYIVPDIWAKGGGMGLATTGNESCPLSVVQLFSEVDNGLPTTISSIYRIAVIPTNLILDFSFEAVPICASTPAKWTIVEGEDETKYVKIAGYENTVKGWFKIQKYQAAAYKIVFCPTDEETCVDIGISKDHNGNRRLAVSDGNPFVVAFQNAESSAAVA